MTNNFIQKMYNAPEFKGTNDRIRLIVSCLMFKRPINIKAVMELIEAFGYEDFVCEDELNFCKVHDIVFTTGKNGNILSAQYTITTNEIPYNIIHTLQRVYDWSKFYKLVLV